jgi:hypothetical protein
MVQWETPETISGVIFSRDSVSLKPFRGPAQSDGWDGCYQMHQPQKMSAAFCLSGTSEEGIGGGNALVMFFDPYDVAAGPFLCAKSSRLEMPGPDSLRFLVNSGVLLTLNNGNVTSGKTTAQFSKLSTSSARGLMSAGQNSLCHRLQHGEVKEIPIPR